MPSKPRPSDDPVERQRDFIRKREEYEAALDQNSVDLHDGRVPTFGEGALAVMARRVEEARAAVEEIDLTVPVRSAGVPPPSELDSGMGSHHILEARKPSLR